MARGCLIGLAAAVWLCTAAHGREVSGDIGPDAALGPLVGVYLGDLGSMIERRRIRVLVPYSRTFYFIDSDGSQRGLSKEFMDAFEDYLNRRLGRKHLRVQVVFLPVTRDRLVPWLLAGRGDVIAANLTMTESRKRRVRFTVPWKRGVRQVLVSGPSAGPLMVIPELSGRRVLVRRDSSHHESVLALNRRFEVRGMAPMKIETAPERFETGDILEVLSSGAVDLAVVDDYLGRLWAAVLPGLQVHEDIVLREGGDLAFAVRSDNLRLKAVLDEFLESHRAGTLFGNVTQRRYLEDTRWLVDAQSGRTMRRFGEMASLFRHYGERYDLDWLMLVAQGYQESRLDQGALSKAGAIGVMQLLPDTGRDLGVGDITVLENNIHAGARYLRQVIDGHFDDPALDAENRLLFALAAYNAGPTRVRRMRREAETMGLDPDRWFDNVEYVAARQIGRETVEYVSNIYKYHIAFRLAARSPAPTALSAPGPGAASVAGAESP